MFRELRKQDPSLSALAIMYALSEGTLFRNELCGRAWAAGALPPHPQDLSLGASPDAELSARKRMKGDASASPYRSVEATESALGLLPSIALSSAQSGLILLRRDKRGASLRWVL